MLFRNILFFCLMFMWSLSFREGLSGAAENENVTRFLFIYIYLPQSCPRTEAAPVHETEGETGSLSLFAVEKHVWVHTSFLLLSWHLVLLHRKPQQHRIQAVSLKSAFLMKLYSNKIPLIMQRNDALVVRMAV